MVNAKQWAICRAPMEARSQAPFYKQSYIDLGKDSGIYDLDDFRCLFPAVVKKYIDTDKYKHTQDDIHIVYEHCSKAYVLYIASAVCHEVLITLPMLLHKDHMSYAIYIIVCAQAMVTVQHDQLGKARTNMMIHIEDGASLTLLQSNKRAQEQYTHISCYQQSNSFFSLHGWYSKGTYTSVNVFLQEEHAASEIQLGTHIIGDHHAWFKTTQVHQASDTNSKLILKGLLSDNSRSAHIGMVHIDKNVERIDAQLTSRYILLDDRAQAYAVPSLEVLAHDVCCSHASAIGSYDQGQMFYLLSRGLSVQQVQVLLQDAFFSGLWRG